jgi:predicted dehydrogenase
MQNTLSRIAVVGAGLIGRKHIEVVSELAQVDAIIDPNPSAQDLAQQYQSKWFDSLHRYLASNRPDGVIIASPNQLHLEHGQACLNAGVPVLIEKPLADTAAAAASLVQLSTETGTPILVGHHRRHSPLTKRVLELIDGGGLGRIASVNAMFWLNKPGDYFEVDWRRREGGGPTYINLIHDIDLLQCFCGPIAYVQANEGHRIRGFDVEDTSAVIVEFESGALGVVSICDTVSAPWSWELTSGENPKYPKTDQSCYLLGGTQGSVSIPDLRYWSHEGAQSWWSPMQSEALKFEPLDPIVEQFRHFLDVVENGAPPLVTAADGARNIAVLDAIKSAALHGGVQIVGGPSAPLVAMPTGPGTAAQSGSEVEA